MGNARTYTLSINMMDIQSHAETRRTQDYQVVISSFHILTPLAKKSTMYVLFQTPQ